MTDAPLTPHLDDEALSAVLDGEAEVDQTAHADACEACRARLGVLRDVSVVVASPVAAPTDAQRDAAVGAALAAADAATVVPMRRRRVPPPWLAVAAAVVVAVGAISLLARDDGPTAQDTASSDAGADRDATTQEMTADSGASTLAAAAPVDGGDLGEIDVTQLQSQVEGAMTSQRTAAALAAPAAGAAAADSAQRVDTPCEAETRAGYPDLGALVYHATGTVDGDAVVVLAFDVPPDRWVYVLAVDGCAVKNQQTYSP